jgi:hypothetical protein
MVVVDTSPGGPREDLSLASEWDIERIEKRAAEAAVEVEIRKFVRGNSALARSKCWCANGRCHRS